MKRWNKLGIVCIMAAALPMAACAVAEPELTEEQSAQIVEYAAGLLLKYDGNHHNRLAEGEAGAQEENVEELEAPAPVVVPAEEPVTVDVSEETSAEEVGQAQEPEAVVNRSIEEFTGIDGVTISYIGYEVKDTYPDTGEDDLFFAMSASTGCKLLILNFDVLNVGGQDLNLDMISTGTKFKVSINDASPRYVLTTGLLNDLSSYVGTISAGASENLVLVCELPDEEAGSVESISLLMRNASDEGRLTLN